MRTALGQTLRQALDGRLIDRVLARTIRTQRLAQKHRQCLGRRKQPLTVFGQQRLDLIKPMRHCQRIEKGIAIAG
jgi:hypothetical protein